MTVTDVPYNDTKIIGGDIVPHGAAAVKVSDS